MADDGSDLGAGGGDLSGTIGGLQTRTRSLTASANAFANAMTVAFARSAASGKSFDDTLKSLALRLSDLSLQSALRPVGNALGSGLSGLFGGTLPASRGGIRVTSRAGRVRPRARQDR